MNSPILSSTLLLTLLLSVGLFFFIRASTKDRTQTIELVSTQPEASLMAQLQQYLQSRSYTFTLSGVDAEKNSATFEGFVRPSLFLAIFLSSLAAVGILCLILVWSLLVPDWTVAFSMLILLAPGAGAFYWQKAGRKERVWLKVEATGGDCVPPQSLLTVTAHRDELIQLQRSLNLKPAE